MRSAFARVTSTAVLAGAMLAAAACSGSSDPVGEPPLVEEEVFAAQAISVAGTSALALFEPFVAEDQSIVPTLVENPDLNPDLVPGMVMGSVPCASFDWNQEELTATVDFVGCDFGEPGLAVTGTMQFTLELTEPFEVDLVLDNIRVDDVQLDGSFQLIPKRQGAVLSGDVMFQMDGEAVVIGMDDLEVSFFQGGATLGGNVTLQTPAFTGRSSSSAVMLLSGECAPRNGALDFRLDGRPQATITYDPQTPVDGTVDLVVGGQLYPEQALLEPCP